METSDRIPVEIAGNGGLLVLGTVPTSHVFPEADSGDSSNVHLRFKRRSGRLIGIVCECASDARKLPGFEPLPKS